VNPKDGNSKIEFEIVMNGDPIRIEAADAASALQTIRSEEPLHVSSDPRLYHYIIRNNYGSAQGDLYRLFNGERIYNPIRVGGYCLLTYTPKFSSEKRKTLCLVFAIQDVNAWVIRAEGNAIGEELLVQLDLDDPYSLEAYGGTLCDMTVPPSTLDATRDQLRAQRKPGGFGGLT
jgi:hypothetical protein